MTSPRSRPAAASSVSCGERTQGFRACTLKRKERKKKNECTKIPVIVKAEMWATWLPGANKVNYSDALSGRINDAMSVLRAQSWCCPTINAGRSRTSSDFHSTRRGLFYRIAAERTKWWGPCLILCAFFFFPLLPLLIHHDYGWIIVRGKRLCTIQCFFVVFFCVKGTPGLMCVLSTVIGWMNADYCSLLSAISGWGEADCSVHHHLEMYEIDGRSSYNTAALL